MNKKMFKIIASTFALGFLLSVSSCSGSSYEKGGICGEATPDGTNEYSEIRRYYVEQYVYEMNLPVDETLNDAANNEYALYQNKYTVTSSTEGEGYTIVEVNEEDEGYRQAHYLFRYYDKNYGNVYASAVDDYISSFKYSDDINTKVYAVLELCANDAKSGYFPKVANMNLDSNSDTSVRGNQVSSVQSLMTSHSKSCIVFEDGFEDPSTGVILSKKSWKDAWDASFFNGLLVYPMSALINVFVKWFGGVNNGVGQMFAILVVTFIIKLAILGITFKSQSSTQKMQDIQPEVLKIQAKYGQTPTPEQKQRMSMEMMAVYKKYGVKPFAPFLSLLITFPVFIAMYRAVMQLSVLRTGSFLGVIMGNNLSTYLVGENAFNFAALVIFLVMAATQILSMKLPQIMNRKRLTPEARKQQKSTNMMSNFMMIMILVMGFTMPVTMSVYWIASALVSVFQSLIMHKINNGGKKGKFKPKKVDNEPITIPQGYKS